jgi:hypothetical protein
VKRREEGGGVDDEDINVLPLLYTLLEDDGEDRVDNI